MTTTYGKVVTMGQGTKHEKSYDLLITGRMIKKLGPSARSMASKLAGR